MRANVSASTLRLPIDAVRMTVVERWTLGFSQSYSMALNIAAKIGARHKKKLRPITGAALISNTPLFR
jgi:hypothetical protein